MKNFILFTFDLEEWFQVANLQSEISIKDWSNKKSTIEQNAERILSLLKKYNVPATFFILGWVAERHAEVVLRIKEEGHEIASHGYGHELANQLADEAIYNDILKSKQILEAISGERIDGYRAPNFSINDRVLEHLKNLGFIYDSSFNPFRLNPRYGTLQGLGHKIKAGCFQTKNGLYEVPLSSYSFFKLPVPIAGGAYFRIFPFWFFKSLVKRKLKQEPVFNFYLHPWEFEPEQERVKNIRWDYQFRHYYGLKRTAEKLEKLILFLKEKGSEFLTIREYVDRVRERS